MKEGKILIVDDNKNALTALNLMLQFEFGTVVTISKPGQIMTELQKNDFDVVLLDMNFTAGVNTGNEGLYWLGEIKKVSPNCQVVMITAYGDVELAVKALKLGATDFILKPWENEKLLATLKSAYALRCSKQEVDELKTREKNLKKELKPVQSEIIGSSPQIKKVMQMIEKVAGTNANVLITGENGTGKEMVARRIHELSERCNELLVTIDMGSIAPTLFESELFGHKKGAFTDAREDRIGKFQLADRGTLFLDEVANLSLAMQSKLLVALESRTVIPLGSNKPVPIDIHLICATNGNLDEMVSNGLFRQDLLYRINTIRIEIPPLRERAEDIELLATFFLKKYEKKYHRNDLRLSSSAVSSLLKHHWPGNVRELQHAIEKAVILSDNNVLGAESFVFKNTASKSVNTLQTLDEMEKQLINSALEKFNGNLTNVAKQLGVSRQTLYNKIKRYEL